MSTPATPTDETSAGAKSTDVRAGAATGAPRPPVALYVHVPFCLSVCPYCDFVVYAGAAARGPANFVDRLVAALVAEIGLRAAAVRASFTERQPVASVYFGGGTPSLLAPAAVARLLRAVDDGFGIVARAEITLEANPGAADRGDLAGFRACGVNRLSIGAQSLDAAELRHLGRRHEPADVTATVAEARRAGFDNVSLDLLYDAPAQTLGSWRRSLQAALALEPDHVSAYALALGDPDAEGLTGPLGDHLPLRPGARRWRARASREQDDHRAAGQYRLADRLLGGAGLEWYEISNWARPGRESRHNLCYWTGEPYEAVGPGAHAFDGGLTRRWNAANLARYLAALVPVEEGAEAALPPGSSEVLDPLTAAAERSILRLRTRAGLPASVVDAGPGAAAIAWGQEAALLETGRDGRVRLTLRGRLLASEVFARLLPPSQSSSGVAA